MWKRITFANNQKCTRNVNKTIKTSHMALLLIEFIRDRYSPSPFTILNTLIDSKFPLTHKLRFLWWLILFRITCVDDCHSSFVGASQAPHKPVVTSQLYHASCYLLLHARCQSPMTATFRAVANLRPLQFGALRYVARIILLLSHHAHAPNNPILWYEPMLLSFI